MPDAEETPSAPESGEGGDDNHQGDINAGDENTVGEEMGSGNGEEGGNKGPINVGDEQ